jgi:hypothetical protein
MEAQLVNTALLNLNLRLNAAPALTIVKAPGRQQAVPSSGADGFSLELEAALPFEALSRTLNAYLQGKRFALTEGLIRQHVVVEASRLYSNLRGSLVIQVRFSGSFNGTVFLTGKPVYDAAAQKITLQNFDYELETKNLLLRGAKWLFDKLILEEIRKYTVVDVRALYKIIQAKLNEALNKEWAKGIQVAGTTEQLELTGIQVQQEQLVISLYCNGTLQVTIKELEFKL